MGSYNILRATLKSPRCRKEDVSDVDCHFGNTTQMLPLKLGDSYPWIKRRQPQNGGRPQYTISSNFEDTKTDPGRTSVQLINDSHPKPTYPASRLFPCLSARRYDNGFL